MSQQSHAKATVGVAALLTFSFYVPAYFQYEVTEIIPCKSDIIINGTMVNMTHVANSTCYRAKESCFTTTSAWFVYGWIFQICVRFSPTVAIFGFNVAMVIKLRRVWNKRRALREKSQQRELRRRQRVRRFLTEFLQLKSFCIAGGGATSRHRGGQAHRPRRPSNQQGQQHPRGSDRLRRPLQIIVDLYGAWTLQRVLG